MNLIMAGFDPELLFSNILLQETIDLCVQKLFEDKNCIDGLSKNYFRFAHEILWLEKCLPEFKTVI